MKVGIIGAGIGGLSAAIALRKAGHDAEIFEQAEAIEPMGAALSIWPNALQALDEIGVGEALRNIAQPLDDVGIADWCGRDITRFSVSKITGGNGALLPTRSELQQLLLDGASDIPLHLGKKLEGFSDNGDNVSVTFDDGNSCNFDLVVAADGIWSQIAVSLGQPAPEYAGYGGYLALTEAFSGHPAAARGTEYWGRGERIGVFDLKGNRKYWFYMKSGLREDELAKLGLQQLQKELSSWPDEVGSALGATSAESLIAFVVHAKPPPRMMAKGRLVLLGDAAHAMEPNMGQGACQAIEDAVILGRASRTIDAQNIAAAYQSLRMKRVRKFVSLSRQGSIAPHRLPSMLAKPTHVVMRAIFPPLVERQLRTSFAFD